ncbi:hypothetical protein MKQ70_21575 [Chitinophaga sedimenti]|uniref:GIY-YIG nuclease family protein n=1 Tax=Chitinophaga sedimenti TaxID=2033606 RepID=UPI002004FA6C|nr:GIY-YIG nuclease family protein [Chitinophaga sedimenti]MCK7557455.1 hypothetical protein [Chitinophaga sedimenti]
MQINIRKEMTYGSNDKAIPAFARHFYVYIMTDEAHSLLFVGLTNNLFRDVQLHRNGQMEGLPQDKRMHKLVYLEYHEELSEGIWRRNEIFNDTLINQVSLIVQANPAWEDLTPGLEEPVQ